jgi:thiamine-monophosphate kinase
MKQDKITQPLKGLEGEIIRIMKDSFPFYYEKSLGNDCAISHPISKGASMLLTKDLLVEGTHFYPSLPLTQIAYKSLAVNTSDIFADGGTPLAFLIGLGVSKNRKNEILDFTKALCAQALHMGVPIIGGDTVFSKQFVISVTCIGEVREPLWLRQNAKVGDFIYITGPIGGSFQGFKRTQKTKGHFYDLSDPFVKAHLNPPYRKEIVDYLKTHYKDSIHAASDVSDGFLPDLYNIVNESKVGALIEQDAIPLFEGISRKNLESYCYGGEDYEIIFTSSKPIKLSQGSFLSSVYQIGRIIDEKHGIIFSSQRNLKKVDIKKSKKTYKHF